MCKCIEVCAAGQNWQRTALQVTDEIYGLREKVTAPHVLIRPHLAKDGNMWSFLYGDNIQEGVCGYGETVALAAADFDKNWRDQKIPNPAKT